ncbi:unnamed protein product [Caenorhabditis auriculariae]|uniref:Fork-head domain-containing protein n=1 Tax=Caenorhabditis auriculariae TaxID=2777116 RepID=A0A8S1HGG5_9PELO|nr:unnamed protein product [Caenorhabditis auriculariae]
MTELNSSLCQLNWLIAKGGPPAAEENTATTSRKSSKTVSPKVLTDKPPFSYTQLIRMAIQSSPNQQCTLNGIYRYISDSYAYYRENRNASWRNSIRHNLSLNRQFKRLDKREGEKGCFWICVEPPEKKTQVMAGSPPRINPAVRRFFEKGRQQSSESEAGPPSREESLIVAPQSYQHTYFSCLSEGETLSSNYVHRHDFQEQPNNVTDYQAEDDDMTDLNLFASHDLSSSFRDVYNQIFQTSKQKDLHEKEAQIDWLKISLETAGVDYRDEEELSSVDTERFQEYIEHGFPDFQSEASTPRTFNTHERPPDGTYYEEHNGKAAQPFEDDVFRCQVIRKKNYQ